MFPLLLLAAAGFQDTAALDRSVQGIAAVLLSLKKKPVIRYERMSPLTKKLGSELVVSTLCVSL